MHLCSPFGGWVGRLAAGPKRRGVLCLVIIVYLSSSSSFPSPFSFLGTSGLRTTDNKTTANSQQPFIRSFLLPPPLLSPHLLPPPLSSLLSPLLLAFPLSSLLCPSVLCPPLPPSLPLLLFPLLSSLFSPYSLLPRSWCLGLPVFPSAAP